MTAPRDDNLYAPPTADVSSGESAKVPLSLLRRYLLVLVPSTVADVFLVLFLADLGRSPESLGLHVLALIAAWPLPVVLILRPFALEAGGWGKLPLRTRLWVGLGYPFAVAAMAVIIAALLMLAFFIHDGLTRF